MSGGLVNMRATCRACHSPLTLEEMHYYDHGDGTATCDSCEAKWMHAVAEWRRGDDDAPMPERP